MDSLEPLGELPGVDLVMLVTDDGVPIALVGVDSGGAESGDETDAAAIPSMGRGDALAALAVGWLNELKLATAPLSWGEPQRIVMRCARGSIVMRRTRGAILLLLLAQGVSPEDVRLSMDGAVARIERSLRNMGGRSAADARSDATEEDRPGPIPVEGTTRPHDEIQTGINGSGRDQLSGT